MQCTHCNIWRPKDRLNIVTVNKVAGTIITFGSHTVKVTQYCADNDACRLQQVMDIESVKKAGYEVVSQTNPLTIGEEEQLLKRILG